MTSSSSNRTLSSLVYCCTAQDVAVRCCVLPPRPLQESDTSGVNVLGSGAALRSRLIREYSFSSEWPNKEQKQTLRHPISRVDRGAAPTFLVCLIDLGSHLNTRDRTQIKSACKVKTPKNPLQTCLYVSI